MKNRLTHISLLENCELADLVCENPFIRLQKGAKIINTFLQGGNMLGSFTCWSKSKIGRYVATGSFSFISNTSVGNYCTFGSRVSVGAFSHPLNWVSTHEFQFRDTGLIYGETLLKNGEYIFNSNDFLTTIENDVWIGDNVVVKRGVKLSTGCVIGAGAVVTKDVPPYAIVVGNPSKVIRYRFSESEIDRLLISKWWEKSIQELNGPFTSLDDFMKNNGF